MFTLLLHIGSLKDKKMYLHVRSFGFADDDRPRDVDLNWNCCPV